jgi:hypothetical protein
MTGTDLILWRACTEDIFGGEGNTKRGVTYEEGRHQPLQTKERTHTHTHTHTHTRTRAHIQACLSAVLTLVALGP